MKMKQNILKFFFKSYFNKFLIILKKDAVPGPGTYYNQQNASSIKIQHQPEKLQFFGSSSTRFKDMEITGKALGPGDYELRSKDFLPKKVTTQGKMGFQTKKPRFQDGARSGGPIENPGPGTYDPKLTFEDNMARKLQTGYKGQFGINDKRFKLTDEEIPGPGSYFEKDHGRINTPKYFQKGLPQDYYFLQQKNATRDQFLRKHDNVPSVGNYELNYYNIDKKLEKIQEIDPDLMVQVEGLGFNSSQPRFMDQKSQLNDKDKNDDNDESDANIIHYQTLGSLISNFNAKEIKGLGFLSKDKKMKDDYQSKQQFPGPGHYYDPQKNLWNKRTYNIEFTGIQ